MYLIVENTDHSIPALNNINNNWKKDWTMVGWIVDGFLVVLPDCFVKHIEQLAYKLAFDMGQI